MSSKKLIIPSDIKVCATCSYWDGDRAVDEEVGVVVIGEECVGECLVKESELPGLVTAVSQCDCLWEDLTPASAQAPLSPPDDPALADPSS